MTDAARGMSRGAGKRQLAPGPPRAGRRPGQDNGDREGSRQRRWVLLPPRCAVPGRAVARIGQSAAADDGAPYDRPQGLRSAQ
jgi:hypothetical protein